MIKVKRSEERVVADSGWLQSRHTFSSEESEHSYGPMCVLNEHHIGAGQGFKSHRRRDMEILSYVLDGELEHKDSLGSASLLRSGDAQIVSAGTGIRHSEFNHSKTQPLHFLQLWFVPCQKRTVPRYEQRSFPNVEKRGRLRLVGSPDGRSGSLPIHQDVKLYVALLGDSERVAHAPLSARKGWLQVLSGTVEVNGLRLHAGDGVAFEDEANVTAVAKMDETEFLVFDLP